MISSLKPYQIGLLLAAVGPLLVSLDSLGIRLTEEDRWDVAFWFGTFTAAAMVALVPLRTRRSFLAVARSDGLPSLASGLLQTCSTTFFIIALTTTTVANTLVIISAAPVTAAIVARFVIGERASMRVWIGMAGCIGGILIVVSGSLGAGRVTGDLFAVAAITAFAFNLTLWRRFPDINRAVVIGLGGATMALIALTQADPLGVEARSLLILGAVGGVIGPAGRIAIATSTRYLPAAQVSLFTPVETVAAIAWAWLFLSESPPGLTVVGGSVVLVAALYGSSEQPETAVDYIEGVP